MYTVTFTLPGFSTVKRDGIELAGSFAATVNVELRVGEPPGDDHRHRRGAGGGRAEHDGADGA